MRLAIRRLIAQPGYTSAVVLTLALAIAATSASFSAVYTVLLKPQAITDAGDLVVCWAADVPRSLPVVELSYQNFQDWNAGSRSFTHMAAMGSAMWNAVLDGRGEPARLAYAAVSASFFDTLGVSPHLGRGFRPQDDVPNAPNVVILNYGAWLRRFGGDPAIVGTTIRLDDKPYAVVGIMPKGFDFPRGAEFWTPVVPALTAASAEWKTNALTDVGVLFVIGRLRPGATPASAAADLDALAGRIARTTGAYRFGSSVVATPFLEYVLGPVRPALWILFAAVGILLLVACANVSGLMLVRASLRHREHAIQIALGATSGALARAWIAESLIVSVAGGALGLVLSQWIADLIVALGPDDVPRLGDVSVTPAVVAFAAVAIAASAALVGIGPVRQARRADAAPLLGSGDRTTTGARVRRARAALLALQVGLAVVLLAASVVVVQSFARLRSIDLGFVPSDVFTMSVEPRIATPVNAWFDRLLRRVAALPDVEAAGVITVPPLALGPIGQETWVLLEGQPETAAAIEQNPQLNYQAASPGYFETMRIRLVRGRPFTDRDDERAPHVALVSETTARRLWPGADPIGKRLAMPSFDPTHPGTTWRTVVGVVGDVRYRGLTEVRLDVYDPALQSGTIAIHMVVRTATRPLAAAASIRAVARDLDPRVVIDRVATMDDVVSRAMAPWRLSAWMLSLVAAVAFGLSAIGLFSLVSLDAASRRHEFAIRLALGASPRDIVRTATGVAARAVAAGAALGLAGAAAGTRAIRSVLAEVGSLDTWSWSGVLLLVAAVAMIASYLPARRAGGIDPMSLLRRD